MEEGIAFWIKLVGGSLAAVVTAFWAYTKFILERGLFPPSEFSVDAKLVGTHRGCKILEVFMRIKNVGSVALIVSNLRLELLYVQASEEPAKPKDILFLLPEKATYATLEFPHSLIENDLGFGGKIFTGKAGDILQYKDSQGKVLYFKVAKSGVVVLGKDDELLEGTIADAPEAPRQRIIAKIFSWFRRLASRKKVLKERPAKVLHSKDRGGRGIPVLRYDTFVQAGTSQEYSFITALPMSASYVLVFSSFRYGLHARWFEERALRLARCVGLLHFSLSHVTVPHTAQRVFDVTRKEAHSA